MSYLTFKHTSYNETIPDNSLLEMFENLLKTNPKPKTFSQSTYLTCLAIQLLEQLGNRYPSQKDIDAIETRIKRFSKRKFLKDVYKSACINQLNFNQTTENIA